MVVDNKFSIVISGWPAVGKTTIARKLAEEFGLKMYNGGDILKMLAEEKGYSTRSDDWWDTTEAKKFMEERKLDPSFDNKVDKMLVGMVRKGGAIITSYTLPWIVKEDDYIIKIWLRGSSKNRADRMSNRDNISFQEAEKIIKIRDDQNKKIYYQLYKFNFGEDLVVFDYVLNTDKLPLESLIEISKLIVRRQTGE